MIKTLTPLFAIIVAIALFFTYIKPTFDSVKVLQTETEEYRIAIERAGELQREINKLTSQVNSIKVADRDFKSFHA